MNSLIIHLTYSGNSEIFDIIATEIFKILPDTANYQIIKLSIAMPAHKTINA